MARDAQAKVATARQTVLRYRDVMLPLETRVGVEMQLQYNAMQIGVFELLAAKERQIRTGAGFVEALRDYWLAHTGFSQILSGRPAPRGAAASAAPGGSADMTGAANH